MLLKRTSGGDMTESRVQALFHKIVHAIAKPAQKAHPAKETNNVDLLQEILRWSRVNAQRQSEILKIQFLSYWEEEMEKPRNSKPKRLLRHGFKIYSQNDEDGIIQEIFRRIGVGDRRFVEFGVQTGVECNTAKLLVEGWRGLWIEADARSANQIRGGFADFLESGKLRLIEEMVSAENINALLDQAGFVGSIDLLSIDIDFNDYWVWKAIEAAQPRVVVIEYNASLSPPLSLVTPYSPARACHVANYFGTI